MAVTGPPSLFEISMAMGWLVSRMPIFPLPAVSFGETDGAARKTIVSGPGQKRSMSFRASSGMSVRKGLQVPDVSDHDENGVLEVPPLDPEDFLDRRLVARVGPQAIERLRRERDHSALFQKGNGPVDSVRLRLFRIDF